MSEWIPFVIRREGPAWKVGYSFVGESGPKRGDVKHSAEGWWPGIYSRLDGNDFASWHFTVGYDRTEQHYPISAFCWHAGDVGDDGGVAANVDLIGIEHLGVAGQPLTDYQLAMTVRITRFCAEQFGRRIFARYPASLATWMLVEHREVSDVPTACPSGRIPWAKVLGQLAPPKEEHMETYVLIKPSNANWTYLAAKIGGIFIWKRYVATQMELNELLWALSLSSVVVLSADIVDAIPRIG